MAAFPVSENVARMQASSTLKAAQAAAELRAKGVDVIDLSVGEPDFDTPQFIKDYAIEALGLGITKYTASSGLASFREAIANFYSRRFGAIINPTEIAAACGGKQALFNAAACILNPGDELLIPRPYWVTFPEIGTFCRARNVFIDTEETNFILTADQVRDAISIRSKLLIINSPNNPTGRVIPPDEMRRIVEVCAERGVCVLTDECYLLFVYPPAEAYSLASLDAEARKHVCVAGSFSKTYAMTGWRCGYTIANPEWTRAMVKLQSHSATHPTSFVQYACGKALDDAERSRVAVETMLAEYERRRAYLIPALNEIPGFKVSVPEGAFYAFADVRALVGKRWASSEKFAESLLKDAHTVVTDGAGFGADGFIRISYATSLENLERAIANIKQVIERA